VEVGPGSLGDRDTVPYTTYVAFYGTLPDPFAPARARFASGVEFLGATVEPAGRDLRVWLRWRATALLPEDYTVFVHYLRDGERIGQADSAAASGYYPTDRWQPGDVINDDHLIQGVGEPIPGSDVLRFGLWRPESGEVLYVLDDAGHPASDWLEIPVGG
jgi:hypothetical protein